jgi:hypothetical protein
VNKSGWRTSELTFAGLTGATIYELASAPVAGLAEAVARAAGCLALAWLAGKYAHARAEAKRDGAE